jgi:hypothetical protein
LGPDWAAFELRVKARITFGHALGVESTQLRQPPVARPSRMRESSREAMRRKILALGAAAAFIVAACSSGTHRASPTTTPPTPSPTASTHPVAPNPDVIPQVITVPYINAVLRVLNHINGDVSRSLLSNKQLTPQARVHLRAIYDDPLYAHELTIAEQSLRGNLSNVRKQPGDIMTTVRELISASTTCIFVETHSDYSLVLINSGQSAASEYFGLARKEPGIDPGHINPTPWALSFNATYLTPTTIPNQCAG